MSCYLIKALARARAFGFVVRVFVRAHFGKRCLASRGEGPSSQSVADIDQMKI